MADEPVKKVSRWSSTRYTNMHIPSYIPPEALVMENGQFLHAFLLRALDSDILRLLATDSAADYYVNLPLTPQYDAAGNRTNTPANLLEEKRRQLLSNLGKLLNAYTTIESGKSREITRKVYFTAEQMDTGAWGAIIGARGAVHQQLEKETNCRIVLAGRGITNPLKDLSGNAAALAMEEPHARLTAESEESLQKAAERIEWILSDDPEAEDFREQNRRRTAQVEGRYNPRTWVTAAEKRAAEEAARDPTAAGPGAKRGREEAAAEEEDADLADFLEGIE